MVGIFSRFSVGRAGHRRTQSAVAEQDVAPPSSGVTATSVVAASATTHGIENAVEFKPIDHPTEPLDNNQPIHCPLPEPSILNDGRIWKERVSSSVQRISDTPTMPEQAPIVPVMPRTKPPTPSNRMILPSISAPEHNILKLLEECNASGNF